MKVSEYTIEFLGDLVAGDMDGTPYRSGPQLVKFFNEFGERDVYPNGGGFPARRIYAQEKLRALNGQAVMKQVISTALDARVFLRHRLDVNPVAARVNDNLKHDGYELVKDGLAYEVHELPADSFNPQLPAKVPHVLTQLAIDDHIRKCEEKLSEGEYSGAIINACSLVESVLIGIEKELDAQAPEHDGNLQALNKRVQKHLDLEPDRKDISRSWRQMFSGLASVVDGLAAVRKKLGSAHATSYPPSRHHAKLAVHAAITLSAFLFETKNYQQARTARPQEQPSGGAET